MGANRGMWTLIEWSRSIPTPLDEIGVPYPTSSSWWDTVTPTTPVGCNKTTPTPLIKQGTPFSPVAWIMGIKFKLQHTIGLPLLLLLDETGYPITSIWWNRVPNWMKQGYLLPHWMKQVHPYPCYINLWYKIECCAVCMEAGPLETCTAGVSFHFEKCC